MGQERFEGQGFRVETPSLQTRAVIWGNHSGAVYQATQWLNDEEILVLYRLADKNKTVKASQAKPKIQAHMLSAARRVGAPLAVFLQVHEKLVEQNSDPLSQDDQTPKVIEVEVRGMNSNTRDLVFGSTVWNSEPLAASDQLVMDLTTFALKKALKNPESSFPPPQILRKKEEQGGHVPGLSAQREKEVSTRLPASQPLVDDPIVTSQISANAEYAWGEQTLDKVDTTLSPSVNANISDSKRQSVSTLQQDVLQQRKLGEKMADPSVPNHEKISPVSSASQPAKSQATVLAQQSAESNYSGGKKKAELDIMPTTPSTDESTRESELQPLSSGSPDEGTPDQETSKGLIIGSGALSLLYTPIKVTYAVLGGFFGGFAYILTGGNAETATVIWDSSLGGTYLIQPEHLRGNESILFMGPSSSTESTP